MEDDEDAPSPSRSPTQSTSRSASPESSPPPVSTSIVAPCSSPLQDNGETAEPVTVAAPAPEHHGLALALAVPIQQSRSSPAGGGGGGRDDCWSEGATSILIDAWGERYLELSRGNLKQKHWQEVADAVTSRDGYTKAPKTDVQCKNRIDTLKKKYKAEKSKISGSGGSSSSWPFFHRLDLLLGPSHKSTAPSGNIPIRPPSRRPQPRPQRQRTNHPTVKKAGKTSPPSVSASSADSSDGFPPPKAANGKRQHEHHQEAEEEGEGEGEGRRTAELKELTRAILRFAEVYEKVESSKLRQTMEMEKQRMELTRELELQRMEFLMKTQMELSQLKSHHHGNSRKRKTNDGGGSRNHHQHRNNTSSNSNNSDNNC